MLNVIAAQESPVLAMIRTAYPGYHPLMSIAKIAHDERADIGLQFAAHKTIAKYVLPELKSVEMTMNEKPQQRVTVSLFDEIDVMEGELVEPVMVQGIDVTRL